MNPVVPGETGDPEPQEPTVFRFVTLSEHEASALLTAMELAADVLGDHNATFGTRLSANGVLRSQAKALRQKQRGVGVLR